MPRGFPFVALIGVIMASVCANLSAVEKAAARRISLPEPGLDSAASVEATLQARRSVRDFTDEPLPLAAAGQLLWAAQGKTSPWGGRTAPSAGALYPLEIYLVAGNVAGLGANVYRYRPPRHELLLHAEGDLRRGLARAAMRQRWITDAAAVLVIAAVYERTAAKYGARAERYVHMEVGHAAQNVYLQAASLGLGTTMVGAFEDDEIQQLLGLPANEAPLALLPVGYPD